ncbi:MULTISPECIES: ATP-binding protein [Halorussus]|uniref:ATP-binding protein n=1 Tax=Halorussus TaxID=1070314 RepID=UPI00209E0FF4|nr:ATP-binding protein [Halorussus vallis]USZ74504.1 ATP-binding protein [Halorussus vallis]
MDPTDDAFFREARTQIRALNDGLLALERGEETAATVEELFRVAHSLKGTCRVQGLADGGELAHGVEDVLAAIRAGEVEPVPDLIDRTLGVVDRLEATVGAAATGEETESDVDATLAALRDSLDEHRERAPESASGDGPLGANRSEAEAEADWDPTDEGLSDDVVAALEATTEFDDIDALVAEMDAEGEGGDEDELDGWGLLDDTAGETDENATPATDPLASGGLETPGDRETPDDPETPAEPSSFFETTKEAVDDEESIDALQADIDDVQFGEFDEDDEYTIEELIALDPDDDLPGGDDPAFEEAPTDASEAVDEGETSADSPAGDPVDLLGADAVPDPASDAAPDAAFAESDSDSAEAAGGDDVPVDLLGGGDASEAEAESRPPTADAGLADAAGTAEESNVTESASDSPADEASEASDDDEKPGGFLFEHDSEDSTETADEDAPAPVDEPADAPVAEREDGEADTDPVEVEADASPEPTDVGDSDHSEDSADVPDPDTTPTDVSLPDAEVPAAEVPDPDSLPETDLGVDLSTDFDEDLAADLDAGRDAVPDMTFSVDEEMAAFESRFDDLLGDRSGEDAGDDRDVFRAAVSTIEESRLDAEAFPTTDAGADSERAGDFDRLQAMTVDVDTADRLLDVAEELSLTHLRLDEAVGPDTDDAIREEVSNLLRTVTEYRRTVMDVRLMPLSAAVETIPRTVRDVARAQDKEVDLDVGDAEVELDRSILDRLRDPLVHLARNAVDHGIESPDEREAAGKPREGTVEIRTERVGDEVVVELADDGRGVDPEAVRERAVEAGVLGFEEAEDLSDDETYDLLFEPGLTTTDEVTDVSGRGVGMDVVRRTVADLDGSVAVESEPGVGTTVRLRVPVSIALTEVLFVSAAGRTFGIPMSSVEQVTPAPPVETEDGREVVRRSDLDLVGGLPEGVEAADAYPLVRLPSALDLPDAGEHGERDADDVTQVVWIRSEAERIAVSVDRIVTTQEVVVRPYGDLLADVPGVGGATTLGDGEAVNVLEVSSL